jgi:hypothetical protein
MDLLRLELLRGGVERADRSLLAGEVRCDPAAAEVPGLREFGGRPSFFWPDLAGGRSPPAMKNRARKYMRVPCPYCKGSGKFRHERPPAVTDQLWFKIVGQAFRCPLCKGIGYIERPLDHLIVDTGLLYIKNNEKRTLVACVEPSCAKWVDATEAFTAKGIVGSGGGKTAQVPQKDFTAKCPDGHEVTITIIPMGKPS